MLFYLLAVLAVLLVAAEWVSAKKNRIIQRDASVGVVWNKVYRWRWTIGVPLIIVSALIRYPLSSESTSYQIMGFPLMVAVFDEAGRDYVGVFTGVSLLGNAVVWYFLPHIVLLVWAKWCGVKCEVS